jgi:D-alanine-D-alanine ligase
MTNQRTHVVVLFGGKSAEHDVSRVSATHVIDALDRDKYDVHAIAISRDGMWFDATKQLQDDGATGDSAEAGVFASAKLVADGVAIDPLSALRPVDGAPTVVFPVLHGPFGEDGTVQGLLEVVGVPYVGSGVLGSSIAMDKSVAKELLGAAGIAQAPFVSFRRHEWTADKAAEVVAQLGLPLFVKPSNLGSSIGISKVKTAADLQAAVEIAFGHDSSIVIEQGVTAREIEVAVLGNDTPRASVPGEIVPSREFYDFEDKYVTDGAQLLAPAKLTDEQSDRVRALALEVFATLRLRGLARIDFLFDEAADVFYCNEANTMPGFTPISMYPRLWRESGLTYSGLLDELIALAQE